jgi:hypothetical protein
MVFPRVSRLFLPDAVVTRNEWPLFCPLVRMACCRCCEKTGACCTDEGCSQETCADCETLEGLFQGVDTVCGEDDECPCAPPADPGQCEKCVDGTPAVYCPEGKPNCCDGVCQAEPCGCCCVDGAPDPTKATEAACDAAGGTWYAGDPCGAYDCRCCDGFKTICHERVWGTYIKVFQSGSLAFCDDCPVNDTGVGTIAIATGNLSCGTTAAEQISTPAWDNRCDTDELENGASITLAKYYDRWRAVADCSECINDAEAAFCVPGVELLGCYAWDDVGLSGMRAYLCECNTVNLCDTEVSGLAVAQQTGPGTELKALLKTIGIVASPTCSCNKRAKVMDEKGCDWCEEHIDEIDGWLAEEAKKRKLPYISLAGKTLIRLAIRRARKKGNSR